jgi:vitamin B12 transporter
MRIFNRTAVAVLALPFALPMTAPAALADTDGDTGEIIVVTATKRPTPLRQIGSSVSVITGQEIAERGYTYVDEALRELAGVNITRNGPPGSLSVARLRGEEAYRTLLLIDGIKVSDVAAPQVLPNLSTVQVSAVERIEVLRGPQALLYGADAIGGVINIITRSGTRAGFVEGGIEGGSFGTFRAEASAGRAWDGGDAAFTASWFRTDGFSAREGDPTLDDSDGARNLTLHGKAGFDLGGGVRVEGVARYVDAMAEFDGFTGDPDRSLESEEWSGRIAMVWAPGDAGHSHTLAYNVYDSRRRDLRAGQPTTDFFGNLISRFDGQRHEVQYHGTLRVAEGHTILFGADWERERVATDSESGARAGHGFFAEWQSELPGDVFVTAGARYDHHAEFGGHLSGRATAAWLPVLLAGEESKLRASVGTGFRAPSLLEQARNRTFSLPPLKEEKAVGFDLGAEQSFFGGRLTVDVTYFDQRIRDEIRFDNVSFTGYFQADGVTTSRGVETALRIMPLDGLTVDLSYTYLDARVRSPDPEDGLMRVRRPRHSGNAALTYRFDDNRAHVTVHAGGAAKTQDGFREFRTTLDDYITVGAAAGYQVTDNVRLFLRGVNLLNAQYQEVAGFATSSRAVYGGVAVRF